MICLLDHLGSDSQLLLRTINEIDKIVKLELETEQVPKQMKHGIKSINKATQSLTEATRKLYNNPARADPLVKKLNKLKEDIIKEVPIKRSEKNANNATLFAITRRLRESVTIFVHRNREKKNYETKLSYFIAFFDTWIYFKLKNPKELDKLPAINRKRKSDPSLKQPIKKIKSSPITSTSVGKDFKRDALVEELRKMKKRVDELLGMTREQIVHQVRPIDGVRPEEGKRFDPYPDYGFNTRYRGTIVYKFFYLYRLVHCPSRFLKRKNRKGSPQLSLNSKDRNTIKNGSLKKILRYFDIEIETDLIKMLHFIKTPANKVNDHFHQLTNF